jgi:hypothetical protein
MSSMRWRALVQLQEAEIDGARQDGAETFLGLPDAWYEPPHWGCENGHVTTWYVKSERAGKSLCSVCMSPVVLLPAGYTDDSLKAAIEALL